MTRLAFSALVAASLTFNAAAQEEFHAYASTMELIEGGTVHTMVVVTGAERMTTRVPVGFGARVEADAKSIVFSQQSLATVITMQVTTNWPGVLPEDDTLKARALAAIPNSAFIQAGTCATGYQPARFIDTVRAISEVKNIRTRRVFVPCPEGAVEFVYSANGPDFESGKAAFNLVLTSFRLDSAPKTPPPKPDAK